eukprot:c23990_g3_i1 orf=3-206(-)
MGAMGSPRCLRCKVAMNNQHGMTGRGLRQHCMCCIIMTRGKDRAANSTQSCRPNISFGMCVRGEDHFF